MDKFEIRIIDEAGTITMEVFDHASSTKLIITADELKESSDTFDSGWLVRKLVSGMKPKYRELIDKYGEI